MFVLTSYFTTYEYDFQLRLAEIEPRDLVDVKLTASSFTDCDGDHRVEYGFLIIYRVLKA